MRFISLIFKNLTRRPFRTTLTLLAFATAIAAVVSLLGIAKGFTKSFADVYQSHSVDVVVSRAGTADRLSSSVDESFVQQIAAVPGVSRSAGVLLETMSLEEQEIYGVPSMGIADGSWLLDDYRLEDQVTVESPDRKRVLLGANLANRVGVKPGEDVMIFEDPYLVSGIFNSQSTWENGSMIFPLSQLQQLADRDGQVTYINVVLDKSFAATKAAQTVEQIGALDSKLNALTTTDFVETDTRMQLATAMAWMTSMIALVLGAFGTLNTMMTSVLERTREIGILRAMGWPRKRVVKMILMESILLAIIASVIGSLMAIAMTSLLARSAATQGILTPAIDGPVLMQGAIIGLVIGVLGALIPAWRASKLLPTEAFRES
ncbi:ABC transporter permease [Planctomycetes bacterium K23_9]|uniref:Macrolide export ATP-binding/permease protein MacB n=1 Tax=Stieleria marina TaxID=1930275 RepID=A0A517NZD6_9BACT|nr:Macrolide export ATP-binding/permease protein MacB [Planctomycetes bacterium K23_9]